jgi:molybdopterin converting factor small subunit
VTPIEEREESVNIRVEYMSQLRTRTGCSEETFALEPGSDLAALLRAIAEHHDESVRDLLFDDGGTPSPTVLGFVRSEQAPWEHVLCDGDVVTLMTPISGG